MNDLQLATTEALLRELETRFQSIIVAGFLPPLNVNAGRDDDDAELAQYKIVKGGAAELNLMLDVMKLEILGEFIGTGRDAEEWEK